MNEQRKVRLFQCLSVNVTIQEFISTEQVVITGGGKHLPLGDNCKTPGLREITNRNAANLKGEVSKSNTRVGLRDITNHTPLAPGTVKKASEKSVERPRSRRASGKKVVTVVSPPAAVANTIATSEDVSVGVQWNDLEPEYMPPSTFGGGLSLLLTRSCCI